MHFWKTIGLALIVGLPLSQAQGAFAAESIPLPFDEGAAVRVIQGYNGGTHTRAAALAWISYWLARKPAARRCCRRWPADCLGIRARDRPAASRLWSPAGASA